ncbi:UNVERIFIED_CONTAM: hypothetical protein RMT77_019861, partial [Armadillidium vulgare]
MLVTQHIDMDLPPIDMAERLKEVNRALAEDSTPIDLKRTPKLRFKEVIAEYQSPRDSDSDDGYGDSSEIMFDAEDENDILYTTTPGPSNVIKNDSDESGDKNNTTTTSTTSTTSTPPTTSSDLPLETTLSTIDKEEEESKFQEVNFSTSTSKRPGSASSKFPLKSILAPSTREEPSSSEEDIPEESKNIVETVEIKSFKLLGSTSSDDSEKLFNKTPSPLEFHNFSDYGDEDVFEVESEISEEIEVETNASFKDSPDCSQVNEKPKKDLSVYIVNNNKSEISNKNDDTTFSSNSNLISVNQNLPLFKEKLLNLENDKQEKKDLCKREYIPEENKGAREDSSGFSIEKSDFKAEY